MTASSDPVLKQSRFPNPLIEYFRYMLVLHVDLGAKSMSEAMLAVLIGVVIFVLGQIVQKFVLEPIYEQVKIIREIAQALVYYASAGGSLHPLEDYLKAKSELRELASRLRASLWGIPAYSFFASLGVVITQENIMKASASLVGWSNTMLQDNVSDTDRREEIARALQIDYKTGTPLPRPFWSKIAPSALAVVVVTSIADKKR